MLFVPVMNAFHSSFFHVLIVIIQDTYVCFPIPIIFVFVYDWRFSAHKSLTSNMSVSVNFRSNFYPRSTND